MIKSQIKVMLAKNDMTQTQLAERSGVSQATISKLNSGAAKQIPIDALDAFCKVFDCQPSDLFAYIPTEKE